MIRNSLLRSFARGLCAFCLVLGIVACGNKGALYLPDAANAPDKKNEQEKKP